MFTQMSILHSNFRRPRSLSHDIKCGNVVRHNWQVSTIFVAFRQNRFCHDRAAVTEEIRPNCHLSQIIGIHLPISKLKDDPFIFTGSSGPSSAAQNSELLRAARQSQERHFAWQKSESNATSHQTNWWHKPFLAARVCFRKKSFHVWTMFQKGQHAAQVSG